MKSSSLWIIKFFFYLSLLSSFVGGVPPKKEKFKVDDIQRKLNESLAYTGASLYHCDEVLKSQIYQEASSSVEAEEILLDFFHTHKWALFPKQQKQILFWGLIPLVTLAIIIITDICIWATGGLESLEKNLLREASKLGLALNVLIKNDKLRYVGRLYGRFYFLGIVNFFISLLAFANQLPSATEQLLSNMGITPPQEGDTKLLSLAMEQSGFGNLSMILFLIAKVITLFLVIPFYPFYIYLHWLWSDFWLDVIFPIQVMKDQITIDDELETLEDHFLLKCKYNKEPMPEDFQHSIVESFLDYRKGEKTFAEAEEHLYMALDFYAAMSLTRGERITIPKEKAHQVLEKEITYFSDPLKRKLHGIMDHALGGNHLPPLLILGDTGVGKTYFSIVLGDVLGTTVRISLEKVDDINELKGTKKEAGLLLKAIVGSYKERGKPVGALLFDDFARPITKNQALSLDIIDFLQAYEGKEIDIPYLGIKIQLPPITLLATSSVFDGTALEKPVQVFEQIEFDGLTTENKKRLVYEKILPELGETLGMDTTNFTPEQEREINRIIQEDYTRSFRPIHSKISHFLLALKPTLRTKSSKNLGLS